LSESGFSGLKDFQDFQDFGDLSCSSSNPVNPDSDNFVTAVFTTLETSPDYSGLCVCIFCINAGRRLRGRAGSALNTCNQGNAKYHPGFHIRRLMKMWFVR